MNRRLAQGWRVVAASSLLPTQYGTGHCVLTRFPQRRHFGVSGSRDESAPSIAPGVMGIRACAFALLGQQRKLLSTVNDDQYVFQSPLVQASIGQHTRHSLDHLRKPLEVWLASGHQHEVTIQYDQRARNTSVEHDRHAAIHQIEQIQHDLDTIGVDALAAPVGAAFMLSGDGHEFVFDSTLSRELAFAVHHCIHHNALVKILLRHHFPQVVLPDSYGMAPSTLNFNLTHPTSGDAK